MRMFEEFNTVQFRTKVDQIVRNNSLGAMGVGLIPVPVVDLVGISGVQVNMLRQLAKEYNVPFSKNLAKSVIISLVGGSLAATMGPSLACSLGKAVPGIGQAACAAALPVIAGATTYAIGKVFIKHFDSGGTFMTFNAEKMKDYYSKMFQEGKNVVSRLKNKKVRNCES